MINICGDVHFHANGQAFQGFNEMIDLSPVSMAYVSDSGVADTTPITALPTALRLLHDWQDYGGAVSAVDGETPVRAGSHIETHFRIDGIRVRYEGKRLDLKVGEPVAVAGFAGVEPYTAHFVARGKDMRVDRPYSANLSMAAGGVLIVLAAPALVNLAMLLTYILIAGAGLCVFHAFEWKKGERLARRRLADVLASPRFQPARQSSGPWG
jgi:hypothetical protein